MDSLRLLVNEPLPDSHPASAILGELVTPSTPLGPFTMAAAHTLLRDVAFGVSDLLAARRQRVLITVASDSAPPTGAPQGAPWELALERRQHQTLVSVFRQGACPEVAQWEHAIPLKRATQSLLLCLGQLDSIAPQPTKMSGLALARQQLERAECLPEPSELAAPTTMLCAASAESAMLRLRVQASLAPRSQVSAGVSRSDLHALLFRGKLVMDRAGNTRSFERVHIFLLLEQLLGQVARALHCASLSTGYGERRLVAGFSSEVQMKSDGTLDWRLAHSAAAADAGWRLAQLSVQQWATVLGGLAADFCNQLLRIDPSQRDNLRLAAFRQRLARLEDHRRRGRQPRSVLNGAPESYRAFAEAETPRPPQITVQGPAVERLRYTESWRADVPGIDLRSFFLVGNAVLVGSTREVACIERETGEFIWRKPMRRGASVLTAVGLVRLSPQGDLTLHDLRDGQAIETLQLAPSVGGSTRGTVIRAPGLPNMLLVADGAEHLTAVDLDAVEVRWRRPLERRGPVQLRRAGKLVIVNAGGNDMLALDLLTGEVVWRRASAHRYCRPVVVDQNGIYALASGEAHNRALALQHIDPWTGEERWSAKLKSEWGAKGPLLACRGSIATVTQDGNMRGVIAFDRNSGEQLFHLPHGLCRGDAACMAIDDTIIANGAGGELVALDGSTGETRYRHVFASRSNGADDRPDSLMPVLRAGALFVPQTEVYAVRPQDGGLVGTLPSDLIADAMRVDERCGVYVAEQSGYVAAYHPGARLRLLHGTKR